ncbi:Afadin [Trichinella pseudospiralis]|uniref:Afadin n=1 Tax=Trichinella pseudospiralis TaxID=6337 RepID=A0A0V1FQY2_TRIPS|nr:Afadin [Trichinella pseudospiralis]
MEYSNLDEKHAMRVQLTKLIEDWNASRLDLFALCEPNEELEFHGVMRFYFQDSGQKMATKCIRVSSTATTRAVIEALIEKFHADLRLLSTPSYSLWEVHENGEKRKLLADEKPLLVQLNWHKDDREGRFLLQIDKADQQHQQRNLHPLEAIENGASMRRKLSKRESKKLEKQQKMNQIREAEDVTKLLYSAVPNTNFTRTISNPEIVMKKRRERKLEQKLKDLGEGGSLKIYGEELSETKPYVTLLLSLRDRADKVVKETLEKYGLDRHCSDDFCLVQLCTNEQGDIYERLLDKDDCPLLILAQEANESNCVTFHVRRKPSTLSRSTTGFTGAAGRIADGPRPSIQAQQHNNKLDTLPYLLEINPDGSEPAGASRIFVIRPNVTEVGSDRTFTKPGVQALCLYGPHVHPRHCVIAFMDGLTTLTPCDATAEITVDDVSITETTILKQNNLIRIGGIHLFRFYETGGENMNSVHAEAFMKPNTTTTTNNINNNNSNSTNDNNASSYGSVIGGGRIADSSINGMERILHAAGGMSPRAQELGSNAKFLTRTSSNVEDVIPALFEFSNNVEDDLLNAFIGELIPSNVSFKLTSAYMLYMCCRYRIVRYLDVGRSWSTCSSSLNCFLTKTSRMINETIQAHCQDAGALAFWMSNLAEALNFLKLDVDLAACSSPEPQGSMADLIQKAFDYLTVCLKQDLHTAMPPILDPQALDQAATEPCLHVLNCVMNLLRVNRVNAALTIQLFSQLFHYINMYLFNWLISSEGSVYCCRRWGIKLRSRLSYVLAWAEKQGLELAAECRLVRILEASQLLQLDFKRGFTKLNSLQTASLLERYIPEADEPPLDRETVTALIQFAEREVDRCQSYEHVPLQLEEEIDLLLPFLIPDDGYSPEMVRGIPAGLQDFANSLAQRGFGQLLIQPTSSGSWAVHFSGDSLFDIPCRKLYNNNLTSVMMNNSGDLAAHSRQAFTGTRLIEKMGAIPTPLLLLQKRQNSVNRSSESDTTGPHLMFVSFEKGSNGIGLSIVQAQGNEDQMPGIYVKKVVPGSAAAQDGRLQAGDQLLKVNGQSLIGVSQECAAQMMSQSGQVVNFEVAKGAALYNGLAQWIYQLSPDNRQQQQQMHPVANSPIIYSHHVNTASPVRRHVGGELVPSQPTSNGTNNGNNYRYSTSDIHHGRRLVKQFQQPPVSNSRFHSTIGQQMGRSGRSLSASSLLHEMQMERSLGRGRTDSVPSSPAFSSRSDRVFHNAKMIPNSTSGVTKHHQTSADGAAIAAGYNPIVRQSVGARRSAGSQQIYSHETQSSPQQHTVNKNYANYNQAVNTTRQSPRLNLPQPQTADFYGSAQQKQTIANGGACVSSSMQQLPPSAQLSQRPPSRSDLYSTPIMMSDQNSNSRLIPCLENGTRTNPYPADLLEPNEIDREDLEQQVDSEMEKLMRDELARLQSKSSLTAAEQRRYRALRYELEFRRRLSNSSHTDDNHYQQIYDPNQQQQHNNYSKSYELDMSHRGNSFNVPVHCPSSSVQSASGNSDTSALNESACARRQQQRDLYFEDAERRYQQIAAKEWNRTQQKDSAITCGRLGQAAVKNMTTAEPVANGRGALHNFDSTMLQTESQMKNLSVTANGGNRMMDSNLKASSASAENTANIRKMTPVTTSRPQVQFDTAPPAVYHVETLDDDQRFLDFVTSTSETRPVSNELEQMITSTDGSSTSEHHHLPTVHPAESRYVYQVHEETPRVIGNQEVYKDPRQERLKHLKPNNSQVEGEKLSFRDKMKLFAKEINESTPKPGLKS